MNRSSEILERILLVQAIVMLCLCGYSLIFSNKLYEFSVTSGIDLLIPGFVMDSATNNLQILTLVENRIYAEGFFGLKIFSFVALVVFSVFIFGFVYLRRKEIVNTSKILESGFFRLVFVAAFGALEIWWTQVSGDFYWASDFDYSGALRPWFGSVAFALTVWTIPICVFVPLFGVSSFLNRLK